MDALSSWFILKRVPKVGNLIFKRLMNHFGDPEKVLKAPSDELVKVKGVTRKIAAAIQQNHEISWIEKELKSVTDKGYRIITQADPAYPPLLLEIPDPPPFLYAYGNVEPLSLKIAVVGSRNATRYGLSTAKKLAAALTARQVTVVSGMARGIDTAAHIGAIESKGKTIAVLGSGFDKIYPRENINLFHRIAENGAVLSEFHLNEGPKAHHFPIRNRIISGLCRGTVVVEASRKSGSLITAGLSAEQNREVFAIPGSIRSFKSAGTHALIKQGAKLVEHAQDIFDEIGPGMNMDPLPQDASEHHDAPFVDEKEKKVLAILEPYPIGIDDLTQRLSMKPENLLVVLLQLELKGLITQEPGNRFTLSA